MNKTWKWILFSIAAVVVLVLILRAASGKADDTKVTAEAAKQRTIVETVSASGKLYPENEIRITPAVAGEVSELNVQEGQRVEKGQTLAFIKGDRTAPASPKVSLPANVPPGFESLLQGVQQSRTSSPSSASIKAPMSGTVLDLSVKKGEHVAGGELMRIADLSTLEVRVNVNENNIIKITVGDSADVQIEAYNKRKFKGVVTTITNGSKRDAQSFLPGADVTAYEVHVRLLPSSYADLYDSSKHNVPFRPGMTAKTEIKTARHENVLSVPVGAVVSRPKGSEENNTESPKKTKDKNDTEEGTTDDELEEVVFVLKADNTVEKRSVTTGLQDMTYFEILNGLKEGEKVVTAPYAAVSKTLRSGNKVSVVSRDKLFETK